MKPYRHAQSSVKKWGGRVEDYLPIHDFLDSSKAVLPDGRHRALTHNTWFISTVIEKVFGHVLTNSDNKIVCVKDIAEQHVSEDFNGYIPTAQDFLQEMTYKPWMNNGKGEPPLSSVLYKKEKDHEERSHPSDARSGGSTSAGDQSE